MTEFVLIAETMALALWIGSVWYAQRLLENTMHVTAVWFFIRITAFFFALAAFSDIAQWTNTIPHTMERLQDIFVGIGSSTLLSTVYVSYREKRLHADIERNI